MPAFPRAARMLQPADYAATLRTRPIARGALLVLNHKRVNNTPRARLGLIIPKRFLKKAVARNAVKRVLREFFRTHQHQLPPGNYAFRLHASIKPMSLMTLKQTIRKECEPLLSKLMSP